MMRTLGLLQFVSVAALGAASLTGALPAAAQDTVLDSGTLDKETAEKVFSPPSGPIRPGPDATSRRGRCSATPTPTPPFPWMPAPSVRASDPRDAYRFAKGEEIMASSGQLAKLSRPLDFLVVTDHSDNMGFFPDLLPGKPDILADPSGRQWYDMMQSGQGAAAAVEIITAFGAGQVHRADPLFARLRRLSLGLAGDHRRGGGGERSRPLHGLHRLRMDLEHRRQQSASQRHLPRQWRSRPPGRALHRARRRAATIRATCGSGWRPMRTRPAATCSPSPTTAIFPTAACSR